MRERQEQANWRALLLSMFHDPPDKALDIKNHERRAAKLASLALGEPITKEEVHKEARFEDIISAVTERVPMPKPGKDYQWAVGPDGGTLEVVHPLSGQHEQLDVDALELERPYEVLSELLEGVEGERERYLAVWRLFRDRLAVEDPTWASLPADTRQPDHTIWHHLDLAAGVSEGASDGGGLTFLSFALGPVQPFIAASRTVRDLWSGSYILSWLTFHAMLPVVEACGPAAFVYPKLRGVPLMDRWLSMQPGLGDKIEAPKPEKLLSPCLPNRFLAVVPWGGDGSRAEALAEACETALREEWRRICEATRKQLDQRSFKELDPEWDRLWERQVESFFEVRTSLLHRRDFKDRELARLLDAETELAEAEQVRTLARLLPPEDRPGYDQESAVGLWGAQLEVSARMMAARRAVRHFPNSAPEGEMVPPKCSLLGTFEQMGPAELEKSREFWRELEGFNFDGTHMRSQERLSAIALVKRFAWPSYFVKELRCPPRVKRIPDTATIAAREWLSEADIDPDKVLGAEGSWSGRWIHWHKPTEEAGDEGAIPEHLWRELQHARKQQKNLPSTYLALLMLDGDRLGRWLRGQYAPRLREAMHPTLRTYWESVEGAKQALDARRPVGGALHAAISEALSGFALHVVPKIVDEHDGELIYAGGDDVMVMLPAAKAVACALALRTAYRRDWYELGERRLLMMGGEATVSAGLAVVHHKEDLRYALDQARAAEKQAKDGGRDALVIAACRRSGEHARVFLPWSMTEDFNDWVERFRAGATDRWAYRARQEVPTLRGLPLEAQRSELLRLVAKTEEEQAGRFEPEAVGAAFDRYLKLARAKASSDDEREVLAERALEQLVIGYQTASFLARGRDL